MIQIPHIPRIESWTGQTNVELVRRIKELRTAKPEIYQHLIYEAARVLIVSPYDALIEKERLATLTPEQRDVEFDAEIKKLDIDIETIEQQKLLAKQQTGQATTQN
jgi:hypothetical protein